MKESKPYPILDEEDGSCMKAQEPVASAVDYTRDVEYSEFHHILGIPQTWDELLECLKEGEEEVERGEYVEWEEAVQLMRQYRRYGS